MTRKIDTKTVTVRRVAPRPRKERVADSRAFVPKTGSLGLSGDLQRLVNSGCFGPDPEVGHAAMIDRESFDRIACTGPGWDEGFGRQVDGLTRWWSTFDPACMDCKRAAREMLRDRGCSDEQIRRAFVAIGAKWTWTTPAKREARRNADAGEMVIDPETGRATTDLALKRRAARRANAIAMEDREADRRDQQRYKTAN